MVVTHQKEIDFYDWKRTQNHQSSYKIWQIRRKNTQIIGCKSCSMWQLVKIGYPSEQLTSWNGSVPISMLVLVAWLLDPPIGPGRPKCPKFPTEDAVSMAMSVKPEPSSRALIRWGRLADDEGRFGISGSILFGIFSVPTWSSSPEDSDSLLTRNC